MDRRLLYSIGLTLAAWPPLFEAPPKLAPEEPKRVALAAPREEDARCLIQRLLPASVRHQQEAERAECREGAQKP